MVLYNNLARNNSQQGYPKLDQEDYIETTIEPFDSKIDAKASAEIEIEMAETIYDMRREFKRSNKRLRKLYSSKEPREYKTKTTSRSSHVSKRRAVA